MKKAIAVLFAVLIVLIVMPFAFADITKGNRISVYDNEGTQDAVVGYKGYIDISNWNWAPNVYACGYPDGTIVNYGMNLQSDAQIAVATDWLNNLDKALFAVFDHFGCVRSGR